MVLGASMLGCALAVPSQADLESGQTGPIAAVVGDELREFVFGGTIEKDFALRDLENGSQGSLRILQSKVQMEWRVSIDKKVFIVSDVAFCATGPSGIECFRLFKPAVKNAKCLYYLVRRKDIGTACLTYRSQQ